MLLSQGRTIPDVCKHLGVADKTYYRWCKAYGGMKVDQGIRRKDFNTENARRKRAVAALTIDKLILKEVVGGHTEPCTLAIYMTSDSPWENYYCESCEGNLPDELLNGELFYMLRKA